MGFNLAFKWLNAELNPICHLLALLGAHLILHVGKTRVKRFAHNLKSSQRRQVNIYVFIHFSDFPLQQTLHA